MFSSTKYGTIKEVLPVLEAYFAWAKRYQQEVLPKSLLGSAIGYSLNQEVYLRSYLLDGRFEISNNRAERAIKPSVIGRKNWLFSNTPRGADASAIIYSIIETAKLRKTPKYQHRFKRRSNEVDALEQRSSRIMQKPV